MTEMVRLKNRLGDLPFDLMWLAALQERTEGVPDWWQQNGNRLLAPPASPVPRLVPHPNVPLPKNAVVAVAASANVAEVTLWGEGALVAVAGGNLGGAVVRCGGLSTVYVGPDVNCTSQPILDARNGGLLYVEADGLWSSEIKLFTDDMHGIIEVATGKRVNAYGGRIVVRRHVWLGYGAMLINGADVGAGSIIGARALVTGTIHENCVAIGSPARPMRSGVTWTHEDNPP